MNERIFVIAVLSALCLMMIFAVPTNSLVGYYDPWLDYNDDGDIDMVDVAASARAFGSFGDPTKYVNVTNWPTSSQLIVWWDEPLGTSAFRFSTFYDSSGFTRIHILAKADGLTAGESIEIRVLGRLSDPDGGIAYAIEAYSITLTSASDTRDQTIFVPSEEFQFTVATDSSSDGDIYLGFYLTWA